MGKEKTILEWFSQLPEPYRSQAIENTKNYDSRSGNEIVKSLGEAIKGGFFWVSTPQKDEYWFRIYHRAVCGKFDKPAIPWPPEADWSNAPKGTFARAVDKDGQCCFYAMGKTTKIWSATWHFCGYVEYMTGVDWENSLEYNLPR